MLRLSDHDLILRQSCGFAALFAITLIICPASAQQFSAQLTRRAADGQSATGRVVVSDDRVRIEAPDFPDGFFIVRRDENAAYLVRPRRHEFMDARQTSPLTEILVPLDPEAPCRQLQAMAEISQSAADGRAWRCDVIGREAFDGRARIRYRMTSPLDRQYTAWVDPQIRFVVRLATDDGTTFTLSDVSEARQPADIFEIPAGLRKFDPAALIERIKRSDAWVEPQQ